MADRSKPDHPNHFVLVSVVAVDSCIDGCADGQTCVRDDAGERCLADAPGLLALRRQDDLRPGGRAGLPRPSAPPPVRSASVWSVRRRSCFCDPMGRSSSSVIRSRGRCAWRRWSAGARRVYSPSMVTAPARTERTERSITASPPPGAQGQLVIFYRDEETQAIRRYIGAIDGQGERTVVDTGRTQSDERGGLDRVQGSDLSLVVEADQELVVFQDQSMGDVSALIAGERRLVRSQLLDGFSARLVRLGGQPLAVHGAVRTDRDGVSPLVLWSSVCSNAAPPQRVVWARLAIFGSQPAHAAKRKPLPVPKDPLALATPTWTAGSAARGSVASQPGKGLRLGAVCPAPPTHKHPQPAEAISLFNASPEPIKLSGLRVEVVSYKRGQEKRRSMTVSGRGVVEPGEESSGWRRTQRSSGGSLDGCRRWLLQSRW